MSPFQLYSALYIIHGHFIFNRDCEAKKSAALFYIIKRLGCLVVLGATSAPIRRMRISPMPVLKKGQGRRCLKLRALYLSKINTDISFLSNRPLSATNRGGGCLNFDLKMIVHEFKYNLRDRSDCVTQFRLMSFLH